MFSWGIFSNGIYGVLNVQMISRLFARLRELSMMQEKLKKEEEKIEFFNENAY